MSVISRQEEKLKELYRQASTLSGSYTHCTCINQHHWFGPILAKGNGSAWARTSFQARLSLSQAFIHSVEMNGLEAIEKFRKFAQNILMGRLLALVDFGRIWQGHFIQRLPRRRLLSLVAHLSEQLRPRQKVQRRTKKTSRP